MPIDPSRIEPSKESSFKQGVTPQKGKMGRGNSVTIGSRTSGAKKTSQVWTRGVKKSQSAPPKLNLKGILELSVMKC